MTDRDLAMRAFPPLQALMADRVEQRAVWYSASTGRWFAGPDGAAEIVGTHGRALRSMLAQQEVTADPQAHPDGRRARPMILTGIGRARLGQTRR